MADTPAADLLVRYWRWLFHLRVHAALEQRLAAGGLTAAGIRRRIERIGRSIFDEARAVLGEEGMLLPPASEESAYVEFSATYWETARFCAQFLPRYFPAIGGPEAVEATLGRGPGPRKLVSRVPAARRSGAQRRMFAGRVVRPGGWPSRGGDRHADGKGDGPHLCEAPGGPFRQIGTCALFRQEVPPPDAESDSAGRAGKHRAGGDLARPRRTLRAPELAGRAWAAVRMDVDRLAARLQAALDIRDQSAEPWQGAPLALVHETPRGRWTARPACCTTCKRSAWTMSGTFTR